MARGRWIKPEFFEDPKMAKLCFQARLLYIGMWTQADDVGNCLASPGFLRSRIFPNDEVTLGDVEVWLDECAVSGRVVRYEACDEPYVNIPNFDKHQRINRKSEWRNPAPPTGLNGRSEGAVSRGGGTSHLNPYPNLNQNLNPIAEALAEAVPKAIDEIDEDWLKEIAEEYPEVDLVFAARALRDHYVDDPRKYGARKTMRRSFRSWLRVQRKFRLRDEAEGKPAKEVDPLEFGAGELNLPDWLKEQA